MSRPFFSIVIPTYNRPDDLNNVIKSVLCQNYSNYEIIVSDNSTNTDSEIICRSFKNKKIKYSKNKDNIGFTRNFYKVIKQAKGKYIYTLSDDDLFLRSDSLANIYKIIQKHHYGYVRQKFIYQ